MATPVLAHAFGGHVREQGDLSVGERAHEVRVGVELGAAVAHASGSGGRLGEGGPAVRGDDAAADPVLRDGSHGDVRLRGDLRVGHRAEELGEGVDHGAAAGAALDRCGRGRGATGPLRAGLRRGDDRGRDLERDLERDRHRGGALHHHRRGAEAAAHHRRIALPCLLTRGCRRGRGLLERLDTMFPAIRLHLRDDDARQGGHLGVRHGPDTAPDGAQRIHHHHRRLRGPCRAALARLRLPARRHRRLRVPAGRERCAQGVGAGAEPLRQGRPARGVLDRKQLGPPGSVEGILNSRDRHRRSVSERGRLRTNVASIEAACGAFPRIDDGYTYRI